MQRNDIAPLLHDFKIGAQKLYGERLKSIILFGSFARGEARADSDVDILLVLEDADVDFYQEVKRLSDLVFEVMMEYQRVISAFPISEKDLEKKVRNPFYINIKKDGVAI